MLLSTASNQLTINHKDGKVPSLGSRLESIIASQDLKLLPVSPLGKLPKRLGPRVEVNQRGLCIFAAVRTALLLSAHRENCVLALIMLMSERIYSFSVLLTTERLMVDIRLITGYVGVALDSL